MSRSIRKENAGSASFAGLMATIILTLIAAAIVDVYRLQDLRTFAYGAANDAALAGVSQGRDWGTYVTNGALALDQTAAAQAAATRLASVMQARGITDYTDQIQVLPDPTGGTAANFPPVTRASLFCAASPCQWTETRPAVGVYVAVTAPTILFGFVNGNQPIVVHVFAAAGVAQK